MRFAQMVECLQFLVASFTPDTSGSLLRYCDRILKELGAACRFDGSSPIGALWSYIRGLAGFPKQERRVNFCRFMAWLRGAKLLLKHWTLMLWLLEHLCLELDMMGTSKLKAIAVKSHVTEQVGEQTTTSSAVPSLESKALRSCCQNAAVVAVMILGDYENRRLMACMVWAADPLERFHGEQNAGCRSVEENKKFADTMIRGGMTAQSLALWNQLGDRDVLVDVDLMSREGYSVLGVGADDPWLNEEDEWAALFGSFIHFLCGNRSMRELYRFGYPHSFVVMRAASKMPSDHMKNLQCDYNIFKSL